MPSKPIFLSYAKEDIDAVRRLKRRLMKDGFRVWMDEHDLLPGQDWDMSIRDAIRNSGLVLVLLSRSAVSKTGYIQKEIRVALDLAEMRPSGQLFVIPVRLDDCQVPERLARWQWLDLRAPEAYRRLRATISANTDIKPELTKSDDLKLFGRFTDAADRFLFEHFIASDAYIYGSLPDYGRMMSQGHFAVFRPKLPSVFRTLKGRVSRYEKLSADSIRPAAPSGHEWRRPFNRVTKLGSPVQSTVFALATRHHVTTVWIDYWRVGLLVSDCRQIYMLPETGQVFVEQDGKLVFTVMPRRLTRFKRRIESWAGSGIQVAWGPDEEE